MDANELYQMLETATNLTFPVIACYFLAKENQRWAAICSQISETLKAMEIRLAELENRFDSISDNKKGAQRDDEYR